MMKRMLTLLAAFLLAAPALVASNPTPNSPADSAHRQGPLASLFSGSWTTSSTPALKVDENFYSNWAATGISQVAFVGTFNGDYKYTHSKFIWDNVADLALGVVWQDLVAKDFVDEQGNSYPLFDTRRKNDDKIDLTSTYSQKLKNAWNVNATVNFKSQFLDGFTYADPSDPGTLVSSFLAPGYLTTALGFECKKNDWNVSLSFLTGKSTFVYDERVIDAGQLYGVDTTHGKRSYFGLGSYAKFYYKKDIAKNLNLYTRLELFYDYRKPTYHDGIAFGDFGSWSNLDPDNAHDYASAPSLTRIGQTVLHDTDVDFEFKLEYRFSSFLAAYFTSRFKYDSDFNSRAPLFGRPDSPWQFYQGAGVQVYFNWKTPKKA